jgi:uncharacterized membrane protein (DUF106 family)
MPYIETDNMPLDSHAAKRKRFNFDPTINLGHVLTFVTFAAMGTAAYFDLRQNQAVDRVRVVMLEREMEAEKQRTGSVVLQIRDDLKEVRRGVDQLRERK